MEMGEEGQDTVVLNIYKDAWLNSLLPPFLCPNNPGDPSSPIIYRHLWGQNRARRCYYQLLLERVLMMGPPGDGPIAKQGSLQ